ncbi:hypothetical protein DPMN_029301 [Dreissena polymorpha]|uniref:Uncharacterized protein n=1 Tax=Dreissena polymorpha TaxID=45954 RepID=A0A9D4LW77_DREPO|nr:hypothetical protein DPMN_029301 [Dreissena polymorpha]
MIKGECLKKNWGVWEGVIMWGGYNVGYGVRGGYNMFKKKWGGGGGGGGSNVGCGVWGGSGEGDIMWEGVILWGGVVVRGDNNGGGGIMWGDGGGFNLSSDNHLVDGPTDRPT